MLLILLRIDSLEMNGTFYSLKNVSLVEFSGSTLGGFLLDLIHTVQSCNVCSTVAEIQLHMYYQMSLLTSASITVFGKKTFPISPL